MTALWSGTVSSSCLNLQVIIIINLYSLISFGDNKQLLTGTFQVRFSFLSAIEFAKFTAWSLSLIIFEHRRKGCGSSLQIEEDYSYQWRETIRG